MNNEYLPAFPTEPHQVLTGLTKREWFIGMALSGIEAQATDDFAARAAVDRADAVLEILRQENGYEGKK